MTHQLDLPGITPTLTAGPLTCPRCGLRLPPQPITATAWHLRCPQARRPGYAPRHTTEEDK
jgi:hypothetical protein